jgi:hypothetical protein
MILVPEIDRADRLDAGAAGKGLEAVLAKDVGF